MRNRNTKQIEQQKLETLTSRELLELYQKEKPNDLRLGQPIFAFLLNLECKDAEGYFEKAAVLNEILRTEKALQACEKVIELKPDYAEVYHLMGSMLYRPWKYEEAIKAFDKVIELKPDFQDVYFNKGWCLCEIERYEEAVECFNIGIGKDEYSEELYASKGWVLMHEMKHKDEEALQAYKKAIELSPNDNVYYFFVGQILKVLGRQEEAKTMINKAIELAPNMEENILYCFDNNDFDYAVLSNKRDSMKLSKAYFRDIEQSEINI